jgi:glycosyltransferase involved in cell wall biosynthesis
MRILSITAGAAGMYCGSCLRDNALAIELLARGHDVTLLPLYTPTLTDEKNVSEPEVLFGGISVYLKQRFPLLRRMPRFVDRLLDAPRTISRFADRSVSTDPRLLGDLTISMLEGKDGALRGEFDKLLDWLADEPLPDVINLPNSMLISLARPISEALKRPVCCTLQGEELFLEGLPEPYRSRAVSLIRQQVPFVDRFIAVSEFCERHMAGFLAIPRKKISVVPLGIDITGYQPRRPSSDGVFRIGYLARLAPEKGLAQLAEAYRLFRRREPKAAVRLEAAGYLAAAHRPYLAEIMREFERAGLSGEFTYHGAVDRDGKLAFLQSIDVLSVPAIYDEPKGIFLLEAMASGVPVVQPRRGAFVEIVESTGGGLLVTPDDPEALAEGLHTMWRDQTLAGESGRRGAERMRTRYTVQQSTARLLEVYAEVQETTGATRAGKRGKRGKTTKRRVSLPKAAPAAGRG